MLLSTTAVATMSLRVSRCACCSALHPVAAQHLHTHTLLFPRRGNTLVLQYAPSRVAAVSCELHSGRGGLCSCSRVNALSCAHLPTYVPTGHHIAGGVGHAHAHVAPALSPALTPAHPQIPAGNHWRCWMRCCFRRRWQNNLQGQPCVRWSSWRRGVFRQCKRTRSAHRAVGARGQERVHHATKTARLHSDASRA
jgi:hypothetical protein